MSNPGGDHGPNQAYVLRHSDEELARLNEQARIFEPITRRFFREAGLVPRMRLLDVGSSAESLHMAAGAAALPAASRIATVAVIVAAGGASDIMNGVFDIATTPEERPLLYYGRR